MDAALSGVDRERYGLDRGVVKSVWREDVKGIGWVERIRRGLDVAGGGGGDVTAAASAASVEAVEAEEVAGDDP